MQPWVGFLQLERADSFVQLLKSCLGQVGRHWTSEDTAIEKDRVGWRIALAPRGVDDLLRSGFGMPGPEKDVFLPTGLTRRG